MPATRKLSPIEQLKLENEQLKTRLAEAEDALNAIRNGDVDAIIVSGEKGEKIFSITSAETPYRIFVEEMSEGAAAVSSDGIIHYCNRRFSEIIGLPSEHILGSHFSKLIEEKEWPRLNEYINAGRSGRCTGTVTARDASGQILHLRLSLSPVPETMFGEICIMITDITKMKQMEIELKSSNEELEQRVLRRTAEIAETNKQLLFQNQVNKSLEQVIYVSSHNLQEPLRTVSNYISVIREDYAPKLDGNALKYLASMNRAVNRMKMLIKALMDTSRLGHDIRLTTINFRELIENVMADLDSVIKSSNAVVEVSSMPVINGYEPELRQLFQNLISNAVKFQKKGNQPRISIRSKKLKNKWQFSVADNGIGIDPVHFDRIFVIFQRLHNSEEFEGNGIGLANCLKIIDLHNGKIWVESEPGNGTTFYFTIPEINI
jgi:PAS domain S-box-containing protein